MRPGDRLPAGPLLGAVRRRYGSLKAAGDAERRALHRLRHTGLSAEQADKWAVRFCFHPAELWPGWDRFEGWKEAS